jgi:hypothetical protein
MEVAREVRRTARNPSQGSFMRSCLEPFVSKISMDLEIVYYEQENGVLQKVGELLVQTRNGASLEDICRDALRSDSTYVQRRVHVRKLKKWVDFTATSVDTATGRRWKLRGRSVEPPGIPRKAVSCVAAWSHSSRK